MHQRKPFQRIGVEAAETLIRRDDALVFDARDAASFARAHIEGARHLVQAELATIIGSTPKSRPILIYCYRGNASQVLAQTFSDFGFPETYSLDGGYEAWATAQKASA